MDRHILTSTQASQDSSKYAAAVYSKGKHMTLNEILWVVLSIVSQLAVFFFRIVLALERLQYKSIQMPILLALGIKFGENLICGITKLDFIW